MPVLDAHRVGAIEVDQSGQARPVSQSEMLERARQRQEDAEIGLGEAGRIASRMRAVRANAPDIEVPDDARGTYHAEDGSVHFIASNLPDVETAQRTFVHEAFGHLARERYPEFAKAIDMVRKLHAMGGLKDIWQEVGRTHRGASELTHIKK